MIKADPVTQSKLPGASPNAIPNVIVVDPQFDSYAPLAAAAREGRIMLHLRSSGRDAIRLARRLRVDAWLVAEDLDDMSGHDFVDLLGQLESVREGSKVAMVTGGTEAARAIAVNEAREAGADAVLPQPISIDDLMRLLSLPVTERDALLSRAGFGRGLVTLPVGIGAAVIAVALLMMG